MKHSAFAVGLMAMILAFVAPEASCAEAVLSGTGITETAFKDALSQQAKLRGFSLDQPQPANATSGWKPLRVSLLIEFDTNSVSLTEEAKKQLTGVGRALNDREVRDYRWRVEGHADPRGSPAKNQRLSEARARAVRDYLVDNENVSGKRLQAVGKGDREPLDRKHPSAAVNRRVTFVERK